MGKLKHRGTELDRAVQRVSVRAGNRAKLYHLMFHLNTGPLWVS